MSVSNAGLQRLIAAFERSDWEDVHLRGEDFEIRLSAEGTPSPVLAPDEGEPPPQAAPEGEVVASPSVGIFWRASSPSAAPFVEVGDEVGPEDTLCIIEVMKLMTQIGPEGRVRVLQILVSDGEAVTAGQPLFAIEPLE